MRKIDLHGYHPDTVRDSNLILDIVRQAWEMAEDSVVIVHGHGRARAARRPFSNSNTGYLGLVVRGILRHDERLRQWMYAKVDVSHDGSTTVRLRKNDQPIRTEFDLAWPESDFRS
jgi:Smr domain